jgi:hypothetical protein
MTCTTTAGAVLSLLFLSTGWACAPVPARALDREGPAIAMARGARWSGLTIHPPYLSGPLFMLTLQHHALTGWVSGESAPAGALRVAIDDDSASGYGPLGPVTMDFEGGDDRDAVQGLWNGRRVHLVIDAGGLRGTVADNSDLPRLVSPTREPAYRPSSCEYVLDGRGSDGAFVGISICAGMPQPTRLEIPPAATAWLSRPELLTILTAFLSAPPVPPSEDPVGLPGPSADFGDWP